MTDREDGGGAGEVLSRGRTGPRPALIVKTVTEDQPGGGSPDRLVEYQEVHHGKEADERHEQLVSSERRLLIISYCEETR